MKPTEHHEGLWTKAFIVLTLSYLLLFLGLQMLLSPFPTYAKQQFHPNDFTVSLVTSLFALSAIATRFTMIPVLRRVHRNIILFLGIFLAGLATILYAYAGNMVQLLLLRILFGIGFGMASTVMPTLVSQIIPKRRLGEGIGYFGLSTSLAMSIGPLVGLSVMKNYGFPLLTVMGTIVILFIVPLLLLTRSIPAPLPVVSIAQDADTENKKGFPIGILLPAGLNMLISITYGGLLGFLALYGEQIHLGNIGLFFLFNACTLLVIRPISGRLFDSKGPGAVLIPAGVLVFASLIVLSYTQSLGFLIVSALLYGLGFGAIQPATQAWMLRQTPPRQHGLVNSLFYNSIDFGVAAGSMVLGIIASATNYAMMYRLSSIAMILFLAVYVMSVMSQRKKKAATQSAPM
ncbi:MFS family permease [Paenibacillus shirakamiensis]|uniref:MFS family permease n=1 Tax=Paenibacillus shirakamiensis TaxID=1265935 RepID=A0ABS4JN25_9BACL|nr:MFS transporter [Paenibacillus shirakamiensis]MBP2002421.1 MFS family permease [Paenibacillus shirakamiensis]